MKPALGMLALPFVLLGAPAGCTHEDVEDAPPLESEIFDPPAAPAEYLGNGVCTAPSTYRHDRARVHAIMINYNECTAELTPSNDAGFDLDAPFRLTLGRGSASMELLPITVSEQGQVLAYRKTWIAAPKPGFWDESKPAVAQHEHAAFILDAAELDALHEHVRTLGLTQLAPAYVDTGVYDGTQWIFRIQQGSLDQIVYFSNRFPAQIVAFADALDQRLDKHDSWEIYDPAEARSEVPEESLWEALRQRDAKLEQAHMLELRDGFARFMATLAPGFPIP